MTPQTYLTEAISQTIWDIKYRYHHGHQVIDLTIEDTWRRIAKAVANVEKAAQRKAWEKQFFSILENFQFLPGGRILAGAGTQHQVTLFNCFVMTIAEDSIEAIFKALAEGALTLQQGGGVGYDFSILRPKGDLVKKTGLSASGPVSFMQIWDTTCAILLSTGARRGAMMGILRCDHPDIEEFIAAKSDPALLRHFNVSIMVTDAFMAAVKDNADWPLVFPVEDPYEGEVLYRNWPGRHEPVPCRIYRYVKAHALWEKIIHSAYQYAEPGVLFGDTINHQNNLYYCETINATNPCGEIPLPAYGACNLGAINLTKFVSNAFSTDAKINWDALINTVRIATRFQDNVIDLSHYPLPSQRQAAENTRRIGLGITGLADVMVMLGIRYGSKQSLDFARTLMQQIMHTTWQTSIELAQEKGSFPLFDKPYLKGEFVQRLDPAIQKDIARLGMRNSHHNTVAPTGTISLLANNVSNGIEPIFKAEYDRHVRAANGDIMTFTVKDYVFKQWQAHGHNNFPPAWVDTDALSPIEHLQVQAAIQPFIDNAISKTINIPVDFPFAKLSEIYSQAYQLGLKGCTIFRPNPITGSVLTRKVEAPPGDHCCQFEE